MGISQSILIDHIDDEVIYSEETFAEKTHYLEGV